MPDINVPAHYGVEYSRNIQLLLQQTNARVAQYADQGMHQGEKAAVVDQVGPREARDVNSRFEPRTYEDSPRDRRWVFPQPSDWDEALDTFDQVKLLLDPKSKITQNGVAAMNRRKDRHMINAFFAPAQVGVNGTDVEQFGTELTTAGGQNIAVSTGGSGPTGLNVEKLKAVQERFLEADVDLDMEEVYVGITSKQHRNLLNEIQIINADFNDQDKPVLVDGKVHRFLGMTFVRTQLIQTGVDNEGGVSRAVPAWLKSGMHVGTWTNMETLIKRNEMLRGLPWTVYLYMIMGATRLEKQRVQRIWCRE